MTLAVFNLSIIAINSKEDSLYINSYTVETVWYIISNRVPGVDILCCLIVGYLATKVPQPDERWFLLMKF